MLCVASRDVQTLRLASLAQGDKSVRIFLLAVFALLSGVQRTASAQQLPFPKGAAADSGAIERAMATLALQVLDRYQSNDEDVFRNTTFRIQAVAGQYRRANATLAQLRVLRQPADTAYARYEYSQYEIFNNAMTVAASLVLPRTEAIKRAFAGVFTPLDNKHAARVAMSFDFNLGPARDDFRSTLERQSVSDSISVGDAVALLRKYYLYRVYETLLAVVPELIRAENARRYIVDENVSIRTRDRSTVSAIVVRPRNGPARQPTALVFTIYAQSGNLTTAMESAANGYVGVVANTRGKRNSSARIEPYEHDGNDAYDVIDWISKQPWSNGKVGMFGGSYDGFTQWASMKQRVHPALKTIVPSAAIVPGYDSPTENGIWQSFHYAWLPYVTNTKLLDDKTLNDGPRWAKLDSLYFASGARYRSLDSIDGTPNALFHRALAHPDYDAYWQAMTPQGKEFAHINIPVLTTTGYFDGAQIGAMRYFREHLTYNPKAEHYLLIGPWDHFGAQGRPANVVAGYQIDEAARVDITSVIYGWLDYVMKGGPKPAILADRINYQLSETNTWKHAPSLAAMSNDTLALYLSSVPFGTAYRLQPEKGADSTFIERTVDLTNRAKETDNAIHSPLANTEVNTVNGVTFITAPLSESIAINGAFTGALRVTINQRDVDVGVHLYELLPDGRYFQLTYYAGRASYAADLRHRKLLTPGAISDIPYSNVRMISRQLTKGSRLVVAVNVNKDSRTPVNYGTGKNVYDETIADGKTPLTIKWHGSSMIRIPVSR